MSVIISLDLDGSQKSIYILVKKTRISVVPQKLGNYHTQHYYSRPSWRYSSLPRCTFCLLVVGTSCLLERLRRAVLLKWRVWCASSSAGNFWRCRSSLKGSTGLQSLVAACSTMVSTVSDSHNSETTNNLPVPCTSKDYYISKSSLSEAHKYPLVNCYLNSIHVHYIGSIIYALVLD